MDVKLVLKATGLKSMDAHTETDAYFVVHSADIVVLFLLFFMLRSLKNQ